MNKFSSAFLLFLLVSSLNETLAQTFEREVSDLYEDYKYDYVFEYAALETNDEIYYSGGTIDFSLIVFDQYWLPTLLSKVVYVELIHEDGSFHERYVFRLDSGALTGHINIPIEIPTGNYQLVTYTHFMRNGDFDLYSDRSQIYIQNLYDSPKEIAKRNFTLLEDRKSRWLGIEDRGNTLMLSVDRKLIEKGKDLYLVAEGLRSLQFIARINRKASFQLPKDLMKSSFQRFVLVSEDKEVLASTNVFLPVDETNQTFKFISDEQLRKPIEKSYLGAGTLHNRLSQVFFKNTWDRALSDAEKEEVQYFPEENLKLRGSISHEEDLNDEIYLLLYYANNRYESSHLIQGEDFAINIILPVGKDQIYWNVINREGEDLTQYVDVKFETELICSYKKRTSFYSDTYSDSVITQNKELHYAISTFNENVDQNISFVDQDYMDDVYLVEDYRGLLSFEDFVREAIPKLSLKKSAVGEELVLYNPEENMVFNSNPVILLNDRVLENESILFEIPLNDILSISLAYSSKNIQKLGSTFRNGVVDVRTKNALSIDINESKQVFNFSAYSSVPRNNSISNIFTPDLELNISDEIKLIRTTPNKDGFQVIQESISPDGKITINSRSSKK